MAGVDAAWLRMERPTNLMMITGVLTFGDGLSAAALKGLLEERLLRFHRFRQRVGDREGDPYWEDDPYFDLDRHVHRLALPPPGDHRALEVLVSDLMNMPLDFGKPPWEMHLVEGYRGGSALIARLHHCIGDGIALIHVLIQMADEYFEAEEAERGGAVEKRERGLLARLTRPVTKTVEAAGAVVHEGMELLLNPAHLAKRAQQGASLSAALGKLALMPSDSDTVFKGELSATKRAAWSEPLALDVVKAIAQRERAKINDVLLAAVAGALRRYLLAHDGEADDVTIRAAIPVNLRPLDRAHELGNRFGLVFLSLPVGMADPHARVAEVKRRMERLKRSAEAPVVLGLLQLAGSGPKVLQDELVRLLGDKTSAVMTNVPGPRERLHLAGAGLRNVMFWVPRAGTVSLGVSIISYAGTVLVGAASDAALVPDPVLLIDGFHEEFRVLKAR